MLLIDRSWVNNNYINLFTRLIWVNIIFGLHDFKSHSNSSNKFIHKFLKSEQSFVENYINEVLTFRFRVLNSLEWQSEQI